MIIALSVVVALLWIWVHVLSKQLFRTEQNLFATRTELASLKSEMERLWDATATNRHEIADHKRDYPPIG